MKKRIIIIPLPSSDTLTDDPNFVDLVGNCCFQTRWCHLLTETAKYWSYQYYTICWAIRSYLRFRPANIFFSNSNKWKEKKSLKYLKKNYGKTCKEFFKVFTKQQHLLPHFLIPQLNSVWTVPLHVLFMN